MKYISVKTIIDNNKLYINLTNLNICLTFSGLKNGTIGTALK